MVFKAALRVSDTAAITVFVLFSDALPTFNITFMAQNSEESEGATPIFSKMMT